MADTIRASAVGASALYFNPAGMSRLNQYSVEAGYSFLNDLAGHAFGVSTVDSATNSALAMGLAYSFVTSELGGRDREGHNFRAALSTGYRAKDFSIFAGVGARYLSIQRGAEDSSKNGEADDPEFFTLDAGVVLQITNIFRLGVVGQNLIDTGERALFDAPRLVGVGAALQFGEFELAFDLEMDLQSDPDDEVLLSYSFAAQYLIKEVVVVRAGFVLDGVMDEKRLAFGASYVSKLIGVDVGFQRSLDRGDDTIVALGVKVFLP